LGIEVKKVHDGLLLTQEKYAIVLLTRVCMIKCTISSNEKPSLTEGSLLGLEDITQYRSIIRAL
jgi:hypothetical protein